jgi:UDP-glucose 4-epimerase
MKILVTGAKGFIAGYLIDQLLDAGHIVIGVDNFSKYGYVIKSYDNYKNYFFYEGDASHVEFMKDMVYDCDHFIACAAKIGGISYFHSFPYKIIRDNEAITIAAFDAAIHAFKKFNLKKITVLSSSMVFENAFEFPTTEDHVHECPPPSSSYGFQKLAVEYFARAALDEYGLPYTIIRPFNCVGTGEYRALSNKTVMSGNIQLAMSHVIPDIIQKVLKGQDPLHILGSGNQIRHYTYGGDIAEGIVRSLENKDTINESFNISTNESTTVLELAKLIWSKINGDKEFKYICDKPFQYDVQKRIPSTQKTFDLLGFEAHTTLESVIDNVINWVKESIKLNLI